MCTRCFENIDTDILTFFQSSDHDKNYIINENEASDTDSDYNSEDEILETCISDDNDLQMN